MELSEMKIVLCIGTVALWSIYFHWNRLLRIIQLTKGITGPSWRRIVDHHSRFMREGNMLVYTTKMCRILGHKPFGFWLPPQYVFAVSDPDSVEKVLKSKNFSNKADIQYNAIGAYCGKTMLVLNGPDWKRHREIIKPAFHKTILESQMDIFNEQAQDLVRTLQDRANNKPTDICHIVEEQFLTMTVNALTSSSFTLTDKREFCDGLSKSLYLAQRNAANPFYRSFWKNISRASRKDETSTQRFLKKVKKRLLEQKAIAASQLQQRADCTPVNAVECMVQGNLKTGEFFTDEEFSDEFFLLIVAAMETSATTTLITILLLALHPNVQQRLFEEINSVLGQNDRPITTADLSRLEYLEMVIKESLRLFPTIPMLCRQAEEKTEINGAIVPKGTCVGIPLMALHRNPKNFKDPKKFDPDRFSPKLAEGHHPFGYLPFSFGPRNCPGRIQAMMQMKVILASVVRQYQFLPVDELKSIYDIKATMCITVQLRECFVRVISRKDHLV